MAPFFAGVDTQRTYQDFNQRRRILVWTTERHQPKESSIRLLGLSALSAWLYCLGFSSVGSHEAHRRPSKCLVNAQTVRVAASTNFPRPASTPRPVSAFRSNSLVRVSGSRAAKTSMEPPVPFCSSGNSRLVGHESCLSSALYPDGYNKKARCHCAGPLTYRALYPFESRLVR